MLYKENFEIITTQNLEKYNLEKYNFEKVVCYKCENVAKYIHKWELFLCCETHYSALENYKFSKNDYDLKTDKEYEKRVYEAETQEEFTREVFDFCQLCHSIEDGLWNKYDGEKVCYTCIEKYKFSTETNDSVKNRVLCGFLRCRYGRTVILTGDY
jgi:hypothetical protein